MGLETKLTIIYILWTIGCIAFGAGVVLYFQQIRVQKAILNVLDIEDELSEDVDEYLLEELDSIVDAIEHLRISKDDGFISQYDYLHDLKNYERRISEIEAKIKQENSQDIQH